MVDRILASNSFGYRLVSFGPAVEQGLDDDHHAVLAASFVLVERDRRVLLVFDRWRQHWELPGGAREADESPRDAAIRELAEETGLRTEELIFVGVSAYETPGEADERVAVYRTTLPDNQPDPVPLFRPDAEIAAIRWWTPVPRPEADNVDPLDAVIIDRVLAEGVH
jgi:8-oxo-dGTP diphosphatase